MGQIERMLSPENLLERHRYRFELHAGSQVEVIEGRFESITVRDSSLGVMVKNLRADKSNPPVFIPWVRVIACGELA